MWEEGCKRMRFAEAKPGESQICAPLTNIKGANESGLI
jgi:hypothetical protein